MKFIQSCIDILGSQQQSFIDLRDIISYVKNTDENYLSLEYSDDEKSRILKLAEMRRDGHPIEYLTHKAEFCSIHFYVDSNVLIPRSDSEFMILEAGKNTRAKSLLDLGSGSGCLSIAYILRQSDNSLLEKVTCLDKSSSALDVCKRNFDNLVNKNLNIEFVNRSWNDYLGATDKFDLIFFNPPYIDEENDEYDDTLKYEPRSALFAKGAGMEHYDFVLSRIAHTMSDDAELYVELSYNKSDEIRNICYKNDLVIIDEIYDMHHLRAFKLQKRKLSIPYDVVDFVHQFNQDIRLVGGSVRDLLLGNVISDYDFCTPLMPDDIIQVASDRKWKTLLYGYEHGTVAIVYKSHVFEITSLRADEDCDGRHARVKFGVSYQEDARRRDFTINALSYDVKSDIVYDYFGGLYDLYSNNVIFVGNAANRIQEDYLRILRYFRFLNRYGGEINSEYTKVIEESSNCLTELSLERVIYELDRIFCTRDESRLRYIVRAMYDLDLFEVLFGVKSINLNDAIFGYGGNLVYATLFYDDLNIYNKMPKAKVREIRILHKFFFHRNYVDVIILYMDGKLTDEVVHSLKHIEDFRLPEKQDYITGADVMNMGYAGKDISKMRYQLVEERLLEKVFFKKKVKNKKM